jgi:hypothetical protein
MTLNEIVDKLKQRKDFSMVKGLETLLMSYNNKYCERQIAQKQKD